MGEPIVSLRHIVKIFPGVVALDDMTLDIQPGEIHGLIGENGAGKSTLIKVLTGVHQPDGGEIYINGEKRSFRGPNDARSAGIACVYQELNILKDSNVIDNLFLGNYKQKKSGLLDRSYMRRRTQEILDLLEQDFQPEALCGALGTGQQQMVEIGRAILTEAQVIILDEPTSSLGEKETENLFRTVRLLQKRGISFLFVSHKLEELFTLCDSVTVMRDSRHIITRPIGDITNDELITCMVGRSLENMYPKKASKPGETLLKVNGLSRMGEYYDISFEARRGEILGFSGLVGAGRTELFRSVFGVSIPDQGTIQVQGRTVSVKTPGKAIAMGIALLPEDRKNQGLILPFSVKWNLCTVVLDRLKKGLVLQRQKFEEISQNCIERLHIKVSSPEQLASQLSGGNQQKVVIGKWLTSNADIYIFDEPTKGIDVGSKVEVYKIMNELVSQNKCVIMISSELPEILGMSDRVVVMRSGRITAEIQRSSPEFNQEDIMKAAWGVN